MRHSLLLLPFIGSFAAGQAVDTTLDITHTLTGWHKKKGSKFLSRNCVEWNWHPDDGNKAHNTQGNFTSPSDINRWVGQKAAYYGAYAHVEGRTYDPKRPSTWFDGREILPYIEHCKKAGSGFIGSVMPTYSYNGFQRNDTNQAYRVAKVMKRFLDAGVPAQLRWGHEMTWYTMPNSSDDGLSPYYPSGPTAAADFVSAWKVMATVARKIDKRIELVWSPNIASVVETEPFFPGPEYVDSIAIDYYPRDPEIKDLTVESLLEHIKPIHDAFSVPHKKPFYYGETGWGSNRVSVADRARYKLQWADVITSNEVCKALPYYSKVYWFEFLKGVDFRLAYPQGTDNHTDITKPFQKLMGVRLW